VAETGDWEQNKNAKEEFFVTEGKFNLIKPINLN
jgi:hypothetical protein